MLFLRTYEGVMGIRVFREFQEFFKKENEKSSGLKLDRDNNSYIVIRVFNSHKLLSLRISAAVIGWPSLY
jgi:hypothetical protein